MKGYRNIEMYSELPFRVSVSLKTYHLGIVRLEISILILILFLVEKIIWQPTKIENSEYFWNFIYVAVVLSER